MCIVSALFDMSALFVFAPPNENTFRRPCSPKPLPAWGTPRAPRGPLPGTPPRPSPWSSPYRPRACRWWTLRRRTQPPFRGGETRIELRGLGSRSFGSGRLVRLLPILYLHKQTKTSNRPTYHAYMGHSSKSWRTASQHKKFALF